MATSAEAPELYEFGEFVLDPARRALCRIEGEAININPKAFDALAYLVARAGHVVERSELSSVLWPRSVVEDNNLTQTIAAIRRALGDADAQQFVATVPRRGYQFVAPVVRRSRSASRSASRAAPPEGGPDPQPIAKGSAARSLRLAAVGLLVLAAISVLAIRQLWTDEPAPPASADSAAARERSIAVLPFENLSPNPEDAFFAAGLHEEILTRLARLDDITVIGRTSVMRYAGSERSIPAVARELGVGAVLEGSVRYAGERVRINVRLVDASSERQRWTETYDAELRDVFAIQSDIATRIAQALDSKLTPAVREKLANEPTQSMSAYAAYLKALTLYRSSGAIGVSMQPQVRQSVRGFLDQAIALDPRFAAALGWRAQLAADSMQFDSFSVLERDKRIAELRAALARDARDALAIDPSLGIAYAALLRLHMFDYRLADALAMLEQSQRLVSDDTTLWQAAAVLHCIRNDMPAAIRAARTASALDPLNPAPNSLLGIALRVEGRQVEAIGALERMIELAPTALIGYVGLARTLTAEGDTPRQRETLKIAEQFLGNVRNFRLDVALSYASIGARADAQRLVAEFHRSMEDKYVDPALQAMALLAVGEHAQAHALLSDMLAAGRSGMDQLPLTLIRYNSWSDPLLDTPEWKSLREALAYRPEREER